MWMIAFPLACALPVMLDGVVTDLPPVPANGWDTYGVTRVVGSPVAPLATLVKNTLGGPVHCYNELFRRVAPLRGYGIGTPSAESAEHAHAEHNSWADATTVRIWTPQQSPLVQPLAIKTGCCGWYLATGAVIFRSSLAHRAVTVVGEESLSHAFEPLFRGRCDIQTSDFLTDVEVTRKQAIFRQPSVESWVLYDVFPPCRLRVHGKRENQWARVEVSKECLDARLAKPFMVPSLEKPSEVTMHRLGYARWVDYDGTVILKDLHASELSSLRDAAFSTLEGVCAQPERLGRHQALIDRTASSLWRESREAECLWINPQQAFFTLIALFR
eukprot:GEMP01013554.1.p1 GENE.GEMP01013554.1~~GEMP01013554.1.p1  ORF type:complete len:329 (+),score=81.48 GEMP01013554.1:1200-2186(+)